MSGAVFASLESAIEVASEVNLSGFGESLLHPRFLEFAHVVKARGASLYFYTNGIKLDRATAQALVQMQTDAIHVSIGGGRPETHARIRGVGLDPVVENLRYLASVKQSSQSALPAVHLEVVALRSALRELPDILRLANSVGAESVNMAQLVAHSAALRDESPWLHVEAARRDLRRGHEVARELGIRLTTPSLTPSTGRCDLLWTDLTITWDGAVMSCHREAFCLGNLHDDAWSTIWNGPRIRSLRKALRDPGLPTLCPGCTVWDNRAECYTNPRDYTRAEGV